MPSASEAVNKSYRIDETYIKRRHLHSNNFVARSTPAFPLPAFSPDTSVHMRYFRDA